MTTINDLARSRFEVYKQAYFAALSGICSERSTITAAMDYHVNDDNQKGFVYIVTAAHQAAMESVAIIEAAKSNFFNDEVV